MNTKSQELIEAMVQPQSFKFEPFLELITDEFSTDLTTGLSTLIKSLGNSIEFINCYMHLDDYNKDTLFKLKQMFDLLYSIKHMLENTKTLCN